MIKIQIKSIFGSVIFEYEKENNTIKDTVEKAVKEGISLESADLRSADLRSADLESADLMSANLRSANLMSANLMSANLRSANLMSANLRSAELESADLMSANLMSANLESANLRSANLPLYCKWSFGIKDDKIFIGCKTKTIEEWDIFFSSNKEYSTSRGTEEFKRIYACYLATKAYLEALEQPLQP